ncbi:MAG TPA: class II glutamine amidotransferase, partial [Orrella sp.]
MCGIVGAVANQNIVPILIEGLQRLEYRGYDSCGVAVHLGGELRRVRSTKRVAELAAQVDLDSITGHTAIAHTRWATHGAPQTQNAHPHFSGRPGRSPRIALVHNGIIENHEELKQTLQAKGYVFESQTDTEVIAHLVDNHYNGDLLVAVQETVKALKGAFAIGVFCRDEPHRIVAAREGSPLVLGLGRHANYLASDALALAGSAERVVYLEDGDIADLQTERVWVFDRAGQEVHRAAQELVAHSNAVELGPYRHFMQKEIFEQPRAVADTLDDLQSITPELFGDSAHGVFANSDRVLILA